MGGSGFSRLVAAVLSIAASSGCRAGASAGVAEGEPKPMTPQLAADLAVIRQARIAFYHHSVGGNVLAGVERLDAESGGERVRMRSWDQAVGVDGPVLAHGEGGRNGEPKSKVDSFAATIRARDGLKPALAFMKFCYVDFDPGTDVDDLLSHYRRALEGLKRDHPEIRFAHVTVPLMERPTDLKSSLRRLLGLEVWQDAANVKRAEYNRRLLEAFAGDPVFDLARIEATGPDGSPSTFEHAGQVYPSLHPRYSEDGGHLNTLGQQVVGTAMVRFAAEALAARRQVR